MFLSYDSIALRFTEIYWNLVLKYRLKHDVYVALVKYKSVFEKQNYYEWIKYLEKANHEEDSYALANKLDASTERQNLNPYRAVLLEFNQTRCFYCGKVLKDESENASPKERNNKLSNIDLPIVKHDFKTYSYFKLEEMWHSAVFNGFEDGWRARV